MKDKKEELELGDRIYLMFARRYTPYTVVGFRNNDVLVKDEQFSGLDNLLPMEDRD